MKQKERDANVTLHSVEKHCFSTEKCRICELKIHGQSCTQQGSSLRPRMSPSGSLSGGFGPRKPPGLENAPGVF